MRALLQQVTCVVGIHDWGEWNKYNNATLSGKKRPDGTWDMEMNSGGTCYVKQCETCGKIKRTERR